MSNPMKKVNFIHKMWIYTGNHSEGRNTIDHDGIAELLSSIGVQAPEETITGRSKAEVEYEDLYRDVASLGEGESTVVSGKRVTCKSRRKVGSNGFGYDVETKYRVDEVK